MDSDLEINKKLHWKASDALFHKFVLENWFRKVDDFTWIIIILLLCDNCCESSGHF